MKKIAWGASKLLHLYLENCGETFDYCIDSSSNQQDICGLKVVRPDVLEKENKEEVFIVIFAVSNKALSAISLDLVNLGYKYKVNFIFYSDYLYVDYCNRCFDAFGFRGNDQLYAYVLSTVLNSKKPIHTTILGNLLFLQCLQAVQPLEGAIAEVGAFEGGNALCALQYLAANRQLSKDFYIMDSFEGFLEVGEFDPATSKRGDYATDYAYEFIKTDFSFFENVHLIKGFVPETFNRIKEDMFSLVFYDCDLYQPAIDTYSFFWERLVPGGFLLIHDYETEPGGFVGVKKATKEFFMDKNVRITSFFHNTMAAIRK